jgi:tagatose-1,6-bisphosphate aldolase non-catalytic subunit AgaZ/GatZ
VLRAEHPARIKAFIDASYGVHKDCKSHSGLCITLGSGPIMTKSTKQKIVTKSSTEAELVAESDFASEAMASRDFLAAQGELTDAAVIFQDNMSTIAMIDNGYSKSDRSRHINIRYFWTKERVDMGELSIVYLPTDEMIADILTKPLQGDKFIKLRSLLLNWVV